MRRFILVFAVATLASLWFSNASAEDWSPLWSTTTMPQANAGMAATSAGGLVFFAGGSNPSSNYSNVVDIYNTSTNVWSTATLSQGRDAVAATSAGNQVFFAGGYNSSGNGYSNVVDTYNTSTGTWSTVTLPQGGGGMAATSAGNQVFFGGGYAASSGASNVVDIYNTSTGTWSTTTLPQGGGGMAATSAGNQVFFGGGSNSSGNGNSNAVDIYNTSTGTWSTAAILPPTSSITVAASAGGKVLFAGNYPYSGEVYDTSTNTWSVTPFPLPGITGVMTATSVGNEVLFACENGVVIIYNTSTNTCSTTQMSQAPSSGLVATSLGNQVFFGCGATSSGASNVVDIYTLQNYGTITSSKAFTLVDQTTVAGLMQLNSPGSFALSSFSLNVGSMSGNAPIDLGSQTLTVGSDNTSNTYSGIISDAGNLVKIGTGTLTLNASNTYTGSTSVTCGTLLLATVNTLSPGTPISVTGGVLDLGGLSQTTSSAICLQNGTIQNGTMIAIGSAYNFQTGIVSANLAGSAGLTKSGSGTLTLSGSNSYTGGTVISQGTLNVTGAMVGGSVLLNGGTVLTGSGMVQSSITGDAGSAIVATGNMTLGDSTTYTGFNHAGTLIIGSNDRDPQQRWLRQPGNVLTSLGGGTLAAPNGVSIGVGCNLVGSGAVNGKIAAGYGSTINATGNLTLGDSTSPVGFVSNGELYTNANTVTLNSINAANNQNAVVLGSLTQIDGGSLVAPMESCWTMATTWSPRMLAEPSAAGLLLVS